MNSRPDWKAERKLNTETFGVGSSRYYGSRGYSRGRNYRGGFQSRGYRGGGGRGYHNRGRGGGGSGNRSSYGRRNNRQWVDYDIDTSSLKRQMPKVTRGLAIPVCRTFFPLGVAWLKSGGGTKLKIRTFGMEGEGRNQKYGPLGGGGIKYGHTFTKSPKNSYTAAKS